MANEGQVADVQWMSWHADSGKGKGKREVEASRWGVKRLPRKKTGEETSKEP